MKAKAVLAIAIAGTIAAVYLWMGGRGSGVQASDPSVFSSVSKIPGGESVVKVQAPVSAVDATAPTAADFAKIRTLDEILASKNDNDPRLDTDFNQLTFVQKRLMRQRYQAMPMEKRNERGTVVFLLGRNLTSPEDVSFLEKVLSEPPCLSMSDCSREDKEGVGSSAHHDDGLNTTLYYPQLVALHSIEGILGSPGQDAPPLSAPMIQEIRKALEISARSPIPSVSGKAEELAQMLGGSG